MPARIIKSGAKLIETEVEMTIVNLTQHSASAEQKNAGVFDVDAQDKEMLSNLLTFAELEDCTPQEIRKRATQIAAIALNYKCDAAMIGGALWLIAPLAKMLRKHGIKPLFAFSKRESVESTDDNGNVVKKSVFRHLGFVEYC